MLARGAFLRHSASVIGALARQGAKWGAPLVHTHTHTHTHTRFSLLWSTPVPTRGSDRTASFSTSFSSSSSSASMQDSSPKSYMRQLLLKIHPDLLREPAHQKTNAQALAVLNAILDARSSELADDASAYKGIRSQKLKFCHLSRKTDAIETFTVEWVLPPPGAKHSRVRVDKFIVLLLQGAGVELDETDLEEWRLEWQRVLAGEATYVYNSHDSLFDRFFAGEEDLPDRHSQLHGVKKRPNSTANLDVWWLAFARDNLSHRAGDKEVGEGAETTKKKPDSPFVAAMLELDLLHFEEELSLAQQHAAMEKFRGLLRKHGSRIRAHEWMGVPVVFTLDETYAPPTMVLARADLGVEASPAGGEAPQGMAEDGDEPCWMLPHDFSYKRAIAYFTRYAKALVESTPGLLETQELKEADVDAYKNSAARGLRKMQKDKAGLFSEDWQGSKEDISARGQGMVDSLKESPREYLRRALQKDKAKR